MNNKIQTIKLVNGTGIDNEQNHLYVKKKNKKSNK